MSRYVYPAVFEKESGSNSAELYSVVFPDLKGCYTSGEGLNDALENAEDILALTLHNLEVAGEEIPPASQIKRIEAPQNAFVSLVLCDTLEYQKMFNSKSVKKTLSIPGWLNELAEKEGVNFSGLLQEALSARLLDK